MKRLKVLLIDVGGLIANLALMKLATYFKAQGYEVYLNSCPTEPDLVFASIVFDKYRYIGEHLQETFKDRIDIGGSGWDKLKKLPPEIETCKPDYNLYGIRYGLGFLLRGCFRNCEHCDVHIKEGKPKQTGLKVKDLVNPLSNFVILLDNNFFANPRWPEHIGEISELGLRVNFSQGIDIRIMKQEMAKALKMVDFRLLNGKDKGLYFAWDRIQDEKEVMQGIEIMLDEGFKGEQLYCYVLAGGPGQTRDDAIYRVMKLQELGINPFLMKYNDRKDDKVLNAVATYTCRRWLSKSITLDEYRPYIKALRGESAKVRQVSMF